jgi:threonine dehydrogenase-like Zn-dependent dehydrogenase
LLCAYSALLRGASKVYSIDRVAQRLAQAKSITAIPIDFSKSDPASQVFYLEPHRMDKSCDCIEFECVNTEGKNLGKLVYTQAINVTRVGGGIGLVGGFFPDDPGKSFLRKRLLLERKLI